ncbi:hypothetical protein GAYE_SCF00G1638 [Galdieria yellowstonensis]|uniref:inositol-3-phosphate synthase n=1 Tax=Galdieria yellowstonensis TaxID=3028027 RepID=A0AAV9I8U6_9RHOD|nr:hypothetical protein GAYE_SCF00G1638 [Galdieria yellowstonensis]
MFLQNFKVDSPNVFYGDDYIESRYDYNTTEVVVSGGTAKAVPKTQTYYFRTKTKVPKLGLLLVGWGGNNGSTVTGGIIANREGISWRTKKGVQEPNYFGSITQSSTLRLGTCKGEDVYVPLKSLLPMVNPNDIEIGGWDINSADLANAMKRAQVFDYDLQRQLEPYMAKLKPMPSIYYEDFIAANQADRADNLIPGKDKKKHLEQIRSDIRKFKEEKKVDKVIVLWTANTERFAEVMEGVNDTAENLLKAIDESHPEIAPSTIFAVASILEGCAFINGSPQNTFVPGCVELAIQKNVFIGGDDFKSGQTKYKSMLVDYLVTSGLKPLSIASYNHLGNNDGKNLSSQKQFRSKEISKSNVVDDMVASNDILFKPGEHPDHIVVIKYVPAVGDSKRALDEYTSEIFMGGQNVIVTHNTCEDSLLAAPLIIDLVVMTELAQRIEYRTGAMTEYTCFHPVLSLLSFMLKAPMVPDGTPVVNALFKQKACIDNILRACLGLAPENDMRLEHKLHPSCLDKAFVETEIDNLKRKGERCNEPEETEVGVKQS